MSGVTDTLPTKKLDGSHRVRPYGTRLGMRARIWSWHLSLYASQCARTAKAMRVCLSAPLLCLVRPPNRRETHATSHSRRRHSRRRVPYFPGGDSLVETSFIDSCLWSKQAASEHSLCPLCFPVSILRAWQSVRFRAPVSDN